MFASKVTTTGAQRVNSEQGEVTKVMNDRKVEPSASCKNTANFHDCELNGVVFHHKIPVKGTDLGKPIEGIAMKIEGGVGYAYTGSAEEGYTNLGGFTSFGEAKRKFAAAKGLTGGSVRNWKLSFQGKRLSIDWPPLRMQETKIPNLTKTKKRSADTANHTRTISKKKTKAKQDATKAKTDANSQEKKGTKDKIPDSAKTKKSSAKCAKNRSANSKKEPKANGDAATVNADADAPEKKGTRDNWKLTTFVITF